MVALPKWARLLVCQTPTMNLGVLILNAAKAFVFFGMMESLWTQKF
jgi:hypothetical protein